MDTIRAKYEPLITFAESRLRAEDVLSVQRAYQICPIYQGVGDSNETKLNNMYYLRDSELAALQPRQHIWPVVVGIGVFILFGLCLKH